MEGHPEGVARSQAADGPHGDRHRARRDLHLGHLHPHRHAAQHLHDALQQRLPEHRLPGPGSGAVQRAGRQRRPQPDPAVDPPRHPAGAGRRGRRRHRLRLRPVRFSPGQGDLERRRPGDRPVIRPGPAGVGAARRAGQRPERVGPGADGRRHGAEVPLPHRPARRDPAQRSLADLHHQRARTLRHGRQLGGSHSGCVQPANGAGGAGRGGPFRRDRRRDGAGSRQVDRSARHRPRPAAGSRW